MTLQTGNILAPAFGEISAAPQALVGAIILGSGSVTQYVVTTGALAGYYGGYYGLKSVALGGGSSDATAPTIAIVSPTVDTTPGAVGGFSADWQTARFTPIVLDVTDVGGNRYQCVTCTYPGSLDEITVYRRAAFRGQFLGRSSASAIANGTRLSILPINGWPSSDALNDISFDADAIDAAGNLT